MDRYLTNIAQRRSWWEVPTAILSAIMGSVALQVTVEDVAKGLQDPVIDMMAHVTVLVMLLLPLYFAGRRMLYRRWARRLARALAERSEDALPTLDLDRITGMKNSERSLRKLLDKGFMRRLAFSKDGMTLELDNPRPAEAPEADDTSGGVLKRIRALNDAIDDAGVSAQIDRIETLTASIFDTVRQRPERADDARRFVNYYLPVTLKLLESYSLMESQSYQGETIQTSRGQIEAALKKLVYAIERQQDRLFRTEALDVETEIQVLETMMRSDGTAISDRPHES